MGPPTERRNWPRCLILTAGRLVRMPGYPLAGTEDSNPDKPSRGCRITKVVKLKRCEVEYIEFWWS